MARKSKRIFPNAPDVQGTSVNSFADFGARNGLFPTISSDSSPALILSGTNQTLAIAFDESVGVTTISGSGFINEKFKELVPNHVISSVMIGQAESLDLETVFKDRYNFWPSGSVSPDLSSGFRSRYLADSSLKDRRLNASVSIFDDFPTNLIVFSASGSAGKGISTALKAGYAAGTKDHFPGETQIMDVIDSAASSCRGFIDGDTMKFFISSTVITSSSPNCLMTTGSFYNLDIENSPFVDSGQKTLMYSGLTDQSIVASFSVTNVSGSINSPYLLPNERFAAGGFTYEPSSLGPDSKGTDSIAFGGWIK